MPARSASRAAWFFAILLGLNVGMVGVYQFVTFVDELHSDSAVKVLLADEILRTGLFFPSDWVYANGDLFTVSPHTIALALIPLFGAGFFTHALTGLIVSLFLLVATAGLLRELGFRRWQLLAILAFIASGVSTLMAETLFGQATYGFLIAMNVTLVAVGLSFVRRFEASRPPWLRLGAFTVLSTLAAINNPKRALAMVGVPFVAACLVAMWRSTKGRVPTLASLRASPHGWLIVGHGVGLFVARLIWRYASSHTHSVDISALTTWLPPEAMWRNATFAAFGLLAHLGGVPQAGGVVATGWGAYDVVRMVVAVPILWGAIKAVRTLLPTDGARGFLAIFTAVSAAISLLFFVFTTLPDASSPLPSARYLVPALFMALLLIPAVLPETPIGGSSRALMVALTVVMCCGVTSLLLPGYGGNGGRWRDAHQRGRDRLALLELIKKAGLGYGFSTYWNAGALTVLSDGAVKVRQVTIDGAPTPMRVHASHRWFRAEEWKDEKTFLLLSESELKRIDRPLLDSRLGPPLETLSFNEFRVLVYPGRLDMLPTWHDVADGIQRFDVAANSLHRIGTFEPGEGGRGRLKSGIGESGELLFGPYLTLPMGHYRVTFDVESNVPSSTPAGTLRVTSRQSTNFLVTAPLTTSGRTAQVLEFMVAAEERSVEFHVVPNGTGEVSVYGVTLERRADR